MQRPLYMTVQDAIEYGIADKIVERDSKAIADVMSAGAWDSAAGLVQKAIWSFRISLLVWSYSKICFSHTQRHKKMLETVFMHTKYLPM